MATFRVPDDCLSRCGQHPPANWTTAPSAAASCARFRLRPTSLRLVRDDNDQVEITLLPESIWDVSAIQWDGTNETDISKMAGGREVFRIADRPGSEESEAAAELRDPDPNYWRLVHPGDWVVRRDDGRVFHLSDDAFRAAYEDVWYDQDGLLPSAVEVRTNTTGQPFSVKVRDL